MNEVRYPYKPKIVVFLLSTLFFVGCTLVFANMALTNDRGLLLNKIIEFSTEEATLFYWGLGAASAAFVIIGIAGLLSNFTTKKEVVLTEDGITAPKSGISKKIVSVKFSEITDLYVQSIHRQRLFNIVHQSGKLVIPQSMLPNKQAFEELIDLVAERISG